MTPPRLFRRDVTVISAAFTQLAAAIKRLVAVFRAAFRALAEALRCHAVVMYPALAQYRTPTSPRTERRRLTAQRDPAERRAFRLAHRAQRRWLRHLGRTR